MELEWKSKYCGVIKEEIPKLATIERAKELTMEETIDNIMASLYTEICKQNAEKVDINFAKSLRYLTKRQKKKLYKWIIKAIERGKNEK